MPKLSQVKIADLVASSRKYAEGQVAKANTNGNAYLTATEAKRLSADLQDNFAASGFKTRWGSVKTADLTREFTVMMEAFARSADTNRDGLLSVTEARGLPTHLRDNFAHFLAAQQDAVVDAGGYATKNETSPARVQEHLAAYGESAVSYEDAFAAALRAAATDEYGLTLFVREFGGEDGMGVSDDAQVDREVRALLENGSMELVPVNEDLPTGESTEDAWIFSIHTDGQGDHGMWAIVDRQSGDAYVTSFN